MANVTETLPPKKEARPAPGTEQTAEAPEDASGGGMLQLARERWRLITFMAGILVVEGIVIWLAGGPPATSGEHGVEVEIGRFVFQPRPDRASPIAEARFQLHVALFADAPEEARAEVDARLFRIRERVEHVLRQARSEDFRDPLLVDLKRRMKEQANKALAHPLVSDCVITEFSVTPAPAPEDNAPPDNATAAK